MTRRCGLRLRERGIAVTVINRSFDAAEELATELGGTPLALSDFRHDPPPRAAPPWSVPVVPPSP